MPQKRTVSANYVGVGVTTDHSRPFTVRARDRRDAERVVVVHMSYAEMVDARDALTELIDNPPAWTRLFTHRPDATRDDA